MRSEFWIALGWAGASVALPLIWRRFKQTQTDSIVQRAAASPWIERAAVFFYFVGVPYLALILGVLTPQLLGLKGLDYFILIDWSHQALGIQLQQAITLTLLAWLLDSQTIILAGVMALLVFAGITKNLSQNGAIIKLPRESLFITIYHAVHWAFYRALFWLATDDLYLGVVLGVTLVMLEWLLFYWVHQHWVTQPRQFWNNSIILILTATVFYYSPNLWLLLPLHGLMVLIANKNWAVGPVKSLVNVTPER